MKIRHALLVTALASASLIAAACGDGSADTSKTLGSVTQTGSPAATPSVKPGATAPAIPDDFGPKPVLGGNVLNIAPGWAAKVAQDATKTKDPRNPKGICADISFDGLPENAQWIRMAVDGVEVTPKLTWIVASKDVAPERGTVCYAPEAGLTVGKHSAAVSVQNPNNPMAATKQLVSWAFEVTP